MTLYALSFSCSCKSNSKLYISLVTFFLIFLFFYFFSLCDQIYQFLVWVVDHVCLGTCLDFLFLTKNKNQSVRNHGNHDEFVCLKNSNAGSLIYVE